MSDAITTCGAAAISIPCLAIYGVDAVAIGFGLVGAIVAQSLLKERDEKPDRTYTIGVMVGSTLFAGATTPALSAYVGGGHVMATQYHAVAAMFLGAFAQPIMIALLTAVKIYGGRLLSKALDRLFGDRTNA